MRRFVAHTSQMLSVRRLFTRAQRECTLGLRRLATGPEPQAPVNNLLSQYSQGTDEGLPVSR